jgi:site-specific DNA-cytosine methylase
MYDVKWDTLNTSTITGLPQNRSRVYIVGIIREFLKHPFVWPAPASSTLPLSSILTDDVGPPGLVDKLNKTKKANLNKLKDLATADDDIIADLGRSSPRTMKNKCMCITASRAGDKAYWSLKRHRQLTMHELMQLQGMSPSNLSGWEHVVSHRQMGEVVGNAMTVSVVQRIVHQIFASFGWDVKPDPFA